MEKIKKSEYKLNQLIRIVILLILSSVLIFAGCGDSRDKETLDSDIWQKIVNIEWSNFDVWAGEGVYFYERDNQPLCAYMIYGSGLPIVALYESKVEIKDKKIVFEILVLDDLPETSDIIEVDFTYEDEQLYYNNKVFKQEVSWDTMKLIEEYKEFSNDRKE